MHIEPGLIAEPKLVLSYATGAAALAYGAKLAFDEARDTGAASLAARAAIATGLVVVFFEVLPHVAVGISEVHLILGTTLLLLFGTGPAAIGLATGLLLQGLLMAPTDLPQYGANVTTLLVPLFALAALTRRLVAPGTAYVDLGYAQVLRMSVAYQGGIVLWVAFWAIWGQGFGATNMAAIGSFGAAYMLVVLVEPLADLAALAAAKATRRLRGSGLVTSRLHGGA